MITQVKLDAYALISVSGPDAQSFLQGQLTCDLKDLDPTHLRLGAYCNLKGRVIVLFKLFLVDSVYYLQCPKDLVDRSLAKLKQHALFSRVDIRDQSEHYIKIGLIGEEKEAEQFFIKYQDLLKNVLVLSVSKGPHNPLADSLKQSHTTPGRRDC
jgi:folate-binding Fe-S cluster repair protein YgfZ